MSEINNGVFNVIDKNQNLYQNKGDSWTDSYFHETYTFKTI